MEPLAQSSTTATASTGHERRSTLADPAALAARLALLRSPHMIALEAHRAWLARRWSRTADGDLTPRPGGLGATPTFALPHADPLDGGSFAPILFLLEKPARLTETPRFVSRDNATPTARTITAFMQQAGLPRRATLLWNAVPWWNGTPRVTAAERRAGAEALAALIAQLPSLKVVVAVGRTAQEVTRLAGVSEPTFASAHPSPNVRAAFPQRWAAIPSVWRSARIAAGLEVLGTATDASEALKLRQ